MLYLFIKYQAKSAKDLCVLDLSNGLQLDLIEILLQQGSGSHSLSMKETDIVSLGTQKLLSKKVIAGSIPNTDEIILDFFIR